MRAAAYARVSTERQERQQTIDRQLTALRTWAAVQGHERDDAHVFRDEGASGSRLDRPALDALRDAVRDRGVEVFGVLTPDRLARKYAYRVLLPEEFRQAGCELVFLQHPISDHLDDQLLLRIQGAIAEYEHEPLGVVEPPLLEPARLARSPGRSGATRLTWRARTPPATASAAARTRNRPARPTRGGRDPPP